MKTLITGATGFVGHHLAQKIPEAVVAGRSVEKLNKRFGKKREARQWDGSAMPDATLLEGIDTVYHLAGESIFHGRWNKAKKERIRASRVDNTRNLVEMISKAADRPKTLICSSAVGYYGSRGDEKLTEQATPGSDFLARVCMDWEKEALKAEEYGVRVVLIRTGVVLGADGGALAQMLQPFKMGVGGRLGSGRQFMSWIHIDDLIAIMLYAKENTSLHGAINAVAPNPLSNSDFTRALASVLHRPAILPAPGFALKLLLGEFANVLLGSQRALPEVLQRAGYTYNYPEIKTALKNLLQ
ncbi:TIGR01777 family protein [Desulfocapsa sulfexigens DSM 10523]|uniref:TIGR01777 family protein n=1 Tax=Desulfocapsa sulfexigens (strain DSM 10523 / SB164P1) TaxID=1167006 RepID=M1PM48_DESSD|nr:TIGR01777 family oxidoreductase [Desulfocapsa sulfexigens]AGF77501.1 TIGR01777 family protein [Desulfocapsa sulfexigens DSM 10523]